MFGQIGATGRGHCGQKCPNFENFAWTKMGGFGKIWDQTFMGISIRGLSRSESVTKCHISQPVASNYSDLAHNNEQRRADPIHRARICICSSCSNARTRHCILRLRMTMSEFSLDSFPDIAGIKRQRQSEWYIVVGEQKFVSVVLDSIAASSDVLLPQASGQTDRLEQVIGRSSIAIFNMWS